MHIPLPFHEKTTTVAVSTGELPDVEVVESLLEEVYATYRTLDEGAVADYIPALVGLPGKSGVSGGIVTIAPGKGGMGTFSPPLDAAGNSVRGQRATRHLAETLGLNVFASKPPEPARPVPPVPPVGSGASG